MNSPELTLEITQRCPNQCLFCSSEATIEAGHLSIKDIEFVMHQARELGLRTSISGGEPLFHPKFNDMISILSESTLYTSGITNEFVAFQEWNKYNKIIFNIQSTSSTTHDNLTGREGSYELSMRSLRAAINLGVPTEVHIIPNRLNLLTVEKSAEDLYKIGVDRISFLRLVVQGRARKHMNELILNQQESDTFTQVGYQLKDKYPQTRFGIPFTAISGEQRYCTAGQGKLVIRYDGKVFPCEAFKDREEFILGDCRTDLLTTLFERATQHSKLAILKQQISLSESCPAQL